MYSHSQEPSYLEHYASSNRTYPSPIDSSSPKIIHYNNNGNSNMPSLMERPFQNRFHHSSSPLPKNTSTKTNKNDVPETNTIVSPSSPNSVEDEMTQKTMQMMFEKKRRRRESHNAVERRRRENINDRINELATLLPDSREAVKSSKGTILRKSADSIRQLHDKLRQHQEKIRELENTLEIYRVRFSQQMIPPGHSLPSLDLSSLSYHHPSANRHF
ncbi:unnamed protein product [Rhizopus stolonifer]